MPKLNKQVTTKGAVMVTCFYTLRISGDVKRSLHLRLEPLSQRSFFPIINQLKYLLVTWPFRKYKCIHTKSQNLRTLTLPGHATSSTSQNDSPLLKTQRKLSMLWINNIFTLIARPHLVKNKFNQPYIFVQDWAQKWIFKYSVVMCPVSILWMRNTCKLQVNNFTEMNEI